MKHLRLAAEQLVLIPALSACLCPVARSQTASQIDAALQGFESTRIERRDASLSALLTDGGIDVHGTNATRVAVLNLLVKHPERAERIKVSLIKELERVGSEIEALMRTDQDVPVATVDYALSLTDSVEALGDRRAVQGLLLTAGVEGLADICPDAVDAIIAQAHGPELSYRGGPRHIRAFAVRTLGHCLQRPALMRANPDMVTKIRRELLADLASEDWEVRLVAAEVISPLRANPEVRSKLEEVAASDPYFGPDLRTKDSLGFRVRAMATRSLAPPDALSFFVTREASSRSCRVERMAEGTNWEAVIGPETADSVGRIMCSHYDPTRQEPSLCWRLEPANACSQ